MYLRLPTSLAAIYGSFTLGLYIAIQGPTLMDLIDLLHVNNDIMSFTIAFSSLAYSVGGLLSGFLFNYVNRQVLIAIYLFFFGLANIVTPFISNYIVYSVITVFKMMCAGGTDCGNNVWMLEMWPGQDAWLQALHCAFAVGCALGPLIVEPFLSGDYKDSSAADAAFEKLTGKNSGSTTISDQGSESRIYIPYGMSGFASIVASAYILWLFFITRRHERRQREQLQLSKQQAGENILLASIKHPAIAGHSHSPPPNKTMIERTNSPDSLDLESGLGESSGCTSKQVGVNALTESAVFLPAKQPQSNPQQQVAAIAPLAAPMSAAAAAAAATSTSQQQQPVIKITSKAREQTEGRPPYYVMVAIALAAMCLSFYCGIEITSMNYLATFAVNIDLQLPKSTAAYMSSALTISFAVGRGFGIWIAAYMRPHKLFYLCCAIMALGNLFMFIFANTAETLLWCSICLFGIGCGPMFPAIVSFYDDRISKVTNTVSGIFILGSMFNVALNSLIIGHHIIDNALILIVCNLIGSVSLLMLFGILHMLTKVKKNQRIKKFKLKQQAALQNAPTVHQPLDSNSLDAHLMLKSRDLKQIEAAIKEEEDEEQENTTTKLSPLALSVSSQLDSSKETTTDDHLKQTTSESLESPTNNETVNGKGS